MKNCTLCGAENAGDAAFCRDCGTTLASPVPAGAAQSAAYGQQPVPSTWSQPSVAAAPAVSPIAPMAFPQAPQPASQPITAASPINGSSGMNGIASSPPPMTNPMMNSRATTPSGLAGAAAGAWNQPGAGTQLIVERRGGHLAMEVAITKPEMVIGRSDVDSAGMPVFPDIDLSEIDTELITSRRHAALFVEQGQVFLEDLGSANGTFVQNVGRLQPGQRHPIPAGTRVMLGRGGPVVYCR